MVLARPHRAQQEPLSHFVSSLTNFATASGVPLEFGEHSLNQDITPQRGGLATPQRAGHPCPMFPLVVAGAGAGAGVAGWFMMQWQEVQGKLVSPSLSPLSLSLSLARWEVAHPDSNSNTHRGRRESARASERAREGGIARQSARAREDATTDKPRTLNSNHRRHFLQSWN